MFVIKQMTTYCLAGISMDFGDSYPHAILFLTYSQAAKLLREESILSIGGISIFSWIQVASDAFCPVFAS